MYTITKSLSSDFSGNFSIIKFTEDIENSSITTQFNGIYTENDDIVFYFESELSAPESTTLDDLVTNYLHESEPEFSGIDKQTAMSTVMTSTTSTSYTDMDSLTLSAKNTSSTVYSLLFNATIQTSSPDKEVSVILNANGVDLPATERKLRIHNADSNTIIMTGCTAADVSNGGIIKVRYKTEIGNTVRVYERVLTINGTYF